MGPCNLSSCSCKSTIPRRATRDGIVVDYIGSIDNFPLCDLQYKLDVHIQHHTTMGVMSTNG
jgi:hypothetical protein